MQGKFTRNRRHFQSLSLSRRRASPQKTISELEVRKGRNTVPDPLAGRLRNRGTPSCDNTGQMPSPDDSHGQWRPIQTCLTASDAEGSGLNAIRCIERHSHKKPLFEIFL